MNTTTELISVDPKAFGLEESKAADIAAQFKPMLDKMVELETEYNQVITLPIEEKETAVKAKNLRLKYVKVRTGTEKIHKEQKAFYLSAGRFVDGWKNTQLFASQGIEKKLEDIERYAENKEKERIAALQSEREQILAPYEVENLSSLALGTMSDEVFANFLLGTKTSYETKKEAERIAEEQRIAAIEAEKKRQEEIKLENDRLKREAEQREAAIRAEREATEKAAALEAERQAAILKAEQEKAAKERAEIEAKLQAERKAAAEKLAQEQEAARKLAAELQAKKEAEEAERQRLSKIEADRIEAEKKAAKAPVKEKLKVAVSALLLQLPESEISQEIQSKFDGFKKWALQQIEAL